MSRRGGRAGSLRAGGGSVLLGLTRREIVLLTLFVPGRPRWRLRWEGEVGGAARKPLEMLYASAGLKFLF
jgi:hypothetical protein